MFHRQQSDLLLPAAHIRRFFGQLTKRLPRRNSRALYRILDRPQVDLDRPTPARVVALQNPYCDPMQRFECPGKTLLDGAFGLLTDSQVLRPQLAQRR